MAKASSPKRADVWKSFLEFCGQRESSQWIYRGVGDAEFELIPRVGREPPSYKKERETAIFDLFERRAQLFQNLDGYSSFDKLVIAQHHGLPTRLLDWTTSPLVAAYFAVTQ